jgi:cysteine desulfurase / selenocysteine lyase
LPDPAVLARMANEFFTALPGYSQPGESVANAESLSGAPSIPSVGSLEIPASVSAGPLPGVGVPTEAELRALPDALAALSSPSASLASVPAPAYSPVVPGAFYAANLSPVPGGSVPGLGGIPGSGAFAGFSFLEEARPLFLDAPALAVPSAPFSANPKNFPQYLPSKPAPEIFYSAAPYGLADAAAPAVGGAPARPEFAARPSSFGFLEDVRSLYPAEVIPAVPPVNDPAQAQPANAPDLRISSRSFEVNEIRRDFPILQERVNGRQLVWLDNAATTQKPQAVIDRLNYFYSHENSNIHRAAHELAARATDAYEAARESARRFLHAPNVRDIIFVRGATEGINLVAQSWGRLNLHKDEEIVITWLEHHANIVPWQMLCSATGARLRVAPVDDTGQVLLDEYAKLLGPKTRLVALPQVSNALGTVTPAAEMIDMAHRHGAKVLLDGAQAVSHMPVDVQLLDCDFYVFSGHKVFAPTGVGVVYGKTDVLAQTPPWQGGGNMIQDVTFEKTVYQTPPLRFEAGTGTIGDAVGLGAAIDYVERIGMANIERYEHDLLLYATESLKTIPGLHIIGTSKEKAGVLSFVIDGFKNEEIGAALNREGIAVRAGHHCAQPILRRFGLESSVRASLALYNTCEEIDSLVAALWNLKHGRGPALQ